jgi:Zn-dependent protease with chaperone function
MCSGAVSQTAATPADERAADRRAVARQSLAAPPQPITAYTLPPELARKARNLNRLRVCFRLLTPAYGFLALWLILQLGIATRLRNWSERFSRRRYVQALSFVALLALSFSVARLPLDIARAWVAKVYEISVQSWPSWAGDWLKSEALTIALGSLLAWMLFAVIRRSPRRWWMYFWLLSLPLLVFGFFIAPYVIDPLFNQFEPLATKAPPLVPELERVSRRAGVKIPPERMFWMKASDKTNATNAYVTGFGASKRIVIWDTTLQQETDDEVMCDFGHELGHYVLGHVWKGMVLSAALLLVLLYLAYRTIGWLMARRGAAWGIRDLHDWAALPALLLVLGVFGFAADVIGNTASRYVENHADIYALEVTHGIVTDPGQAAARSFQQFGEVYLADPSPNPVYVFLFYDHPPISDRIHLAVTYDPWSKGEPPQFVK